MFAVRVSVLDKLFAYRQIFLRLAAHESLQSSDPPAVACWVDVLISKLGDVVQSLMGCSSSSVGSGILMDHVSSRTLRASLQLPGKFSYYSC